MLHCRCGFTCGVESTLQQHINFFMDGQDGVAHGPVDEAHRLVYEKGLFTHGGEPAQYSSAKMLNPIAHDGLQRPDAGGGTSYLLQENGFAAPYAVGLPAAAGGYREPQRCGMELQSELEARIARLRAAAGAATASAIASKERMRALEQQRAAVLATSVKPDADAQAFDPYRFDHQEEKNLELDFAGMEKAFLQDRPRGYVTPGPVLPVFGKADRGSNAVAAASPRQGGGQACSRFAPSARPKASGSPAVTPRKPRQASVPRGQGDATPRGTPCRDRPAVVGASPTLPGAQSRLGSPARSAVAALASLSTPVPTNRRLLSSPTRNAASPVRKIGSPLTKPAAPAMPPAQASRRSVDCLQAGSPPPTPSTAAASGAPPGKRPASRSTSRNAERAPPGSPRRQTSRGHTAAFAPPSQRRALAPHVATNVALAAPRMFETTLRASPSQSASQAASPRARRNSSPARSAARPQQASQRPPCVKAPPSARHSVPTKARMSPVPQPLAPRLAAAPRHKAHPAAQGNMARPVQEPLVPQPSAQYLSTAPIHQAKLVEMESELATALMSSVQPPPPASGLAAATAHAQVVSSVPSPPLATGSLATSLSTLDDAPVVEALSSTATTELMTEFAFALEPELRAESKVLDAEDVAEFVCKAKVAREQ